MLHSLDPGAAEQPGESRDGYSQLKVGLIPAAIALPSFARDHIVRKNKWGT